MRITSSDAFAVLPANSTLTNGQGVFSLTFQTPGNMTVTASDTVATSITGISPTITVSGNGVTHFVLTGLPSSVVAGTKVTFTVTAEDRFNNTVAGYTGPVTVATTSGNVSLPAASTLTGGVGTFSATLERPGNQTFTVIDPTTALLVQSSVTVVAAGHPLISAMASADLNGDGKPDLIIALETALNLSIYLGNGNGTFKSALASPNLDFSRVSSIATGDFNGDGKQDIAVAAGLSFIDVLLGNGNGTFQAPVSYSIGTGLEGYQLTTGDFNGDGNLDLAVTYPESSSNTSGVAILLGNGNGTFKPATSYLFGNHGSASTSASIVAADFNHDGKLDLAVTGIDDSTVDILLGNGNGTFAPAVNYAVGINPTGIAVGDFNADGNVDLAVTNASSGTVSVLLGRGDGTFGAATNYGTGGGPQTIAVGDFNGDGKLDLAVGNNSASTVTVMLGNGDGTFGDFQPVAVNTPNALAAGDFTNNGSTDLVVASEDGSSFTVLLPQPSVTPVIGVSNPIAVNPGNAVALGLEISPVLTADQPFLVTVTALDSYGNLATGYTGTVTFEGISGPPAIFPPSSTLTNGKGVFSVVLTAAGTSEFEVEDVANNIHGAGPVESVGPATATHFIVNSSTTAAIGAALNVTVTAVDQLNNTVSSYTGTVHFASSDSLAVLHSDATLTNGIGIYSVTLNTLGYQTVTVTDNLTSSINGSAVIAVAGPVDDHFIVSAASAIPRVWPST